jgi:phage gpG-like protein|nr:MAG TPA: tail morphogenesis protein [Caudoviricetes sp.]
MDDNGSKKTMRELRGRINRFIRLTLNDIRVEAKDEFDMNFKREAFFTEKWKRRKGDTDETRGLLVQSGTLRRSIRSRIMEGGKGVEITSSVPYAKIHNEGGSITVTRRMKGYFWIKYRQAVGGIARTKARKARNGRKNRQISRDAEFYKAMALKKTGSRIMIPRRQFIGRHPDLEKLLDEIAVENLKKVFNDND